MTLKQGLKTHEVLARLRDKYPAPEYAFFTEISNGTGYSRGERADGLSVGLWPSRGLYVTGFEIKVSRSDWLHEKRRPKKAETIAAYCDFWFLVVGDIGIIRMDEVPENWGVLAPSSKGGLLVAKDPVKLDARPLDKNFIIALARDVHQASASRKELEAATTKATSEAYKRGIKDGEREANYAFPRLEKELSELKEYIAKFEQASGITLSTWDTRNPEKIGKAVRFVLENEVHSHRIAATKTLATELLEGCLAYERFQLANRS